MTTSAQEIYTQTVRNLPPTERLKLGTLILNRHLHNTIKSTNML
jgi:hypothetical protein